MPSTGDSDCGSLELPMYKALLTPFIMSTNAIYCECTAKVQKINEKKLFMNRFFRQKSVFAAKQPKLQLKTTYKWSITLHLAQESVSLEE